ncbi:MAG: cytochrome c3 [Syntrophomonadaceae bacterium]|jgi:cytochrome c nitrite reductase small subunit|nr:cytochrome c3 family protein [Bacillota bacterium]NLM87609.1 cytochrome c3 [Syntrophomonadaceae bacterium]HAA09957.1 cytochrome c3 [Syntrophomonas sp.]HQA49379.1 cytochrome c3 family protein [Syntrophomonadaceae bacterium]HQD89724.1 cytochrome c3 family protein [Syntrophomonadaceae bacterium]
MERKSFRERFLNKKVILIVIGVAVIIGAGTAGALLKASENPSFCATCHLVEPYYVSWSEGVLLDHQHAVEDVTCQECHTRSIPEKAMEGLNFITGNYTLPLEGSQQGDRQFCLECHSEDGDGSSWEEIKLATVFEESNPHDSHHGEQDCNICHNMHEKSYAFCSDCHIFNWLSELDEEVWDKAW